MLKPVMIGLVVAVLAASMGFAPSSAAAPALTGQMKKLQYLVGVWSCHTKVPGMNSMPAHTAKGTASFEIEPGNTVGFGISAEGYSASGFLGYLDAKKLWWNAGSDNFGGVTFETGKDREGTGAVMSGTSTMAGESATTRDTITKTSETKYEDLYQIQKNGTWELGADSVCTKTSNSPD